MKQFFGVCFVLNLISISSLAAEIRGELKRFHRVAIIVDGPETSETNTSNPFANFRFNLKVRSPSGKNLVIPGHFAADANAAESSKSAGNKWRAFVSPEETGTYNFEVSFRAGPWIAVSNDASAGTPQSPDGERGSFIVGASDKSSKDFRAHGRLLFNGGKHLKFSGTGKPWLKGGADSPENILSFHEFDGTKGVGQKSFLHKFSTHVNDWKAGDPLWKGSRGKGIVGAVNYLSNKGANSVYFVMMNVNGDGQDVWPWTSHTQRERYDVSKLDQWEIVFSHMESKGVLMHFVMQEMENSKLLDGGSLGNSRKLYYRELISRFSHHLGLVWLLGEEVQNTTEQLISFGKYFFDNDPYRHVVEVHTGPKSKDKIFTPLLGSPYIQAASIQHEMSGIYDLTQKWLNASREKNAPWLVFFDEQNPPSVGIQPDSKQSQPKLRSSSLWPNLMAGGAGVEWFFGGQDLKLESFKSYSKTWDSTRHALNFFNKYLPYDQMQSSKTLSSGNLTLTKNAQIYVVYSSNNGNKALNLSGVSGDFSVKWYNPATGAELQDGSISKIKAGSTVNLGQAPFSGDSVAFVQKL